MKKFSSRLLKKATKLQRIISETVDAESEVTVMRSYRAADASMTDGYSSRQTHRHRKHVHKTSYTDKVASRISTFIVNRHLKYLAYFVVLYAVVDRVYWEKHSDERNKTFLNF